MVSAEWGCSSFTIGTGQRHRQARSKRLAFSVEATDAIRSEIPDFQLLVIGDGPDRQMVDSAAASRPWLHVLGALKGNPMVDAAVAADLCLNPGLVGLAVLDAFALSLPMVTCDVPYHSPEIEYLVDATA